MKLIVLEKKRFQEYRKLDEIMKGPDVAEEIYSMVVDIIGNEDKHIC